MVILLSLHKLYVVLKLVFVVFVVVFAEVPSQNGEVVFAEVPSQNGEVVFD